MWQFPFILFLVQQQETLKKIGILTCYQPPLLSVPYVNENSQPSATSEASRTIPMQPTSVLPGNNCSTDSNVNCHNLIDSILSNEPSANVHNSYNAGQRQVT